MGGSRVSDALGYAQKVILEQPSVDPRNPEAVACALELQALATLAVAEEIRALRLTLLDESGRVYVRAEVLGV